MIGISMREMTPQIETAEISDAQLDNVSGGVNAGLGGTLAADPSGVSGDLSGGIVGVGGASGSINGGVPSGLSAGLPGVEGVTGLVG
jgi:hypothetical protein